MADVWAILAVNLGKFHLPSQPANAIYKFMAERFKKLLLRGGGSRRLANALGISRQAIEQWRVVPSARVLQVERITGIPRQELRPDLYPHEPEHAR